MREDGSLTVFASVIASWSLARIIQDSSDVLLKATTNGQGQFTGYADVTVNAGLYTETASTRAATWADLDGDGDQDLFVAWDGAVGSSGQDPDRCFYYLNDGPDGQGNYAFIEDGAELLGPVIGGLGHVASVDVGDLDGDGELDITLARQPPGGSDGLPNLLVLLHDGTTDPYQILDAGDVFDSAGALNDVEIADIDGNGVLDLVGIPTDGTQPVVYLGRGTAAERHYFESTYATGLGTGDAFGIASADFNGDTDPDLFLLRPEESQTKAFLWDNPRHDGVPTSGNERYLTVGFGTLPSGVNSQAVGTEVTVTVLKSPGQQIRSTQIVDGGSGHGSQGAGRLIFGLGGQSTAKLDVTWPNGQEQSFLDVSTIPGFPQIELNYAMDPQIDPASITATYTPSQGYTTHKIKWRVEHAPGNPQVMMSIANPNTTECKSILGGGTQLLLQQGVPRVSVQVVPIDGGFECRVHYNVYCNAPCSYNFTVRNEFSGTVYSDGGHIHTVSVCSGFGM